MKAKGFLSQRKRMRMAFIVCGIAIPILNFFVFWIPTNINSLIMAFEVNSPEGTKFGFDYFSMLFNEFGNPFSRISGAVVNTIIFFCVNTFIKLPLCFLFSYFIYKKILGYKVFRYVFYLPSIISSIVMVILFTYFVDSFIPEIAMRWFGSEIRGLLSNPDTTMLMIYLYNILMGFGTNVLLLSSAMSSVSDSIVEAAQLDGANNLQLFWHVVFPQIFPTFVTIFIVSVANLFANQLNLFSFYGSYAEAKYVTVGYLLYKRTVSAANAQYPDLATIGILLTIIIIPVTLGLRKLLEKVGPSDE